jgi:hypothetical protein
MYHNMGHDDGGKIKMEWVNRFVLNPICLVIYHLLPHILFASNTFLRRTIQKRLKLICFARAFGRNHENCCMQLVFRPNQ